MNLRLIALTIGLLAAPCLADTLTGRVVDSTGAPVAGLNIDAKERNIGGNGNIMNDGTNAMGFFTVTINPGTYRLTFQPPPPPAAFGLVLRVDDQVISGVTDLGTLVLEPATSLGGRVVDPGGLPVVGLNLDIIDEVTGNNIDLVRGMTDLLGNFMIAVPVGPIELRMDTGPVVGPILAPDHLFLDATSPIDIGVLQLRPGFTVNAALLDSSFMGIANLDTDVVDTLTGEKLYTPGDNTDVNGFVDFVVPAGNFDIEFCPPPLSNFVAQVNKNVVINATTSLGIITMLPGVRLNGHVTNYLGQAVSGVDLDVRLSGTPNSVLVCSDSSNGLGDYSIVLPVGSYDVTFSPSFSLGLGTTQLTNLAISGTTIRNPVLPFCDMGTSVGRGTAGSGGFVPTLQTHGGSMRLSNKSWGVDIRRGLGGAYCMLSLRLGANCKSRNAGISSKGLGLPIGLPTRAVLKRIYRLSGPLDVAGMGELEVDLPIPNDPSLAGMYLTVNFAIFDPAARGGRAKAPSICGQLCQ